MSFHDIWVNEFVHCRKFHHILVCNSHVDICMNLELWTFVSKVGLIGMEKIGVRLFVLIEVTSYRSNLLIVLL